MPISRQLSSRSNCLVATGYCGNCKKSVYDQVAKNRVTQLQLSRCGGSLVIEEEVVEELLEFILDVIYGDNMSSTIVEVEEVRVSSTPHIPEAPPHPSFGHGWELVVGRCHVVRDLLSSRIYLHEGQLKRARKMRARR